MLHRVWESRMEPFRVFGNLYFVGTKPASAHLIDTGAGLILLDSGYPETLYLVLDSIRRLGFRLEDLALILHSHGHIDHIGGTRAGRADRREDGHWCGRCRYCARQAPADLRQRARHDV